ncbi:MAG: RidA family protein [Acidobacteriota bacterium]
MQKSRRGIMRAVLASAGAMVGANHIVRAQQPSAELKKEVHYRDGRRPENPLFSPAITYGNLVFISGKGAHFEGDISAHTDHVLKTIQEELESVGSSMDKVLKCNVYLHDLKDYQAMNEVFRGRFGAEPPVRTTIACYGGVPGDSLVEIDVIAYR